MMFKQYMCFMILFFLGCNTPSKKVSTQIINNDLINKENNLALIERLQLKDTLVLLGSEIIDYSDSINCTDQFKRKQGTWIYEDPTVAWKVKVQYINDTLHGLWSKESRGFLDSGRFFNGVKQGFQRHYYDRISSNGFNPVATLALMRNDSIIWSMYPAADFGRKHIRKGVAVSDGRIGVSAPYKNGVIAYEGTFINFKAVGVHNSFDKNGKQFISIDYDNHIITEYDSLKITKTKSPYAFELKANKIMNSSSNIFSKYLDNSKVKKFLNK